jgi:hypothetical protein
VSDLDTADLSRHTGYLVPTKTALMSSMKVLFGEDFPDPDYRGLLVSLEFPATKEAYPSIWVDFDPSARLETMGIDHREVYYDDDGTEVLVRRWRFGGTALFTIVALTSLERDALFDHVVSHLAFGPRSAEGSSLRAKIENNDLVALQPNFDSISIQGADASAGTPWGTDEFIYEITLRLALEGEFAVVEDTGALANLSKIDFQPRIFDEPLPLDPPEPPAGTWR